MSVKEYEKYHDVDHFAFQKYIESIGFKISKKIFVYNYNQIQADSTYNNYKIRIYYNHYTFFSGIIYIGTFILNDLTTFQTYFKKEMRSIKLKQILE